MAITSWTTLKTAVASWLARSDLTSQIPDFIALGEARIYRDLRIRAMETSLSTAISAGVVAVPTGYLEMKFAYLNSSPTQKLMRKSPDWIYANYPSRTSGDIPQFFAREGSNFIFGPYPDSGYTMKGVYYKKLTALSGSNESNWFITDAPDLLLYAALCQAEPFLANDERLALWSAAYNSTIKKIQDEDDRECMSGSILMTSRG